MVLCSMVNTSCVAGAKPELPGRLGIDDKAWSTALSTALDTAEAIDLDSWSGCVSIFAITPALVNPRAKSHGRAAVTYDLFKN